ncbi:unnamed protein product [Phytophthora fragariaefolia]|uniref:Unnamed protein product n=1 Tax=Phytophthora fragariaefolia TaxID=1490495 RepID=A0A9W6Y7A6_9STRA|nr:unnamed protein product [Phytophthora fragariaefolia]
MYEVVSRVAFLNTGAKPEREVSAGVGPAAGTLKIVQASCSRVVSRAPAIILEIPLDFVLNMTADGGTGLGEVQGTRTDTTDQDTGGMPNLLQVDKSRRAKRRPDTTDEGMVQENHPPTAGSEAARC